MKKKFLSAVLCLCLILGLMPGTALGTEEGNASDEAVLDESEARYQTAEGGGWIYGSLADACDAAYDGGRIEVLRDMELTEGVTAAKTLTIASADPNTPCTITYTTEKREDGYLLTVRGNVTLENIILDGGREQGRVTHTELVGVRSGTLTMEDGAVIRNNDNIDTAKGAGGLRVIEGQAIMKKGSAIRSCRGTAGGGAAVAGSQAVLVLDGGVIEDCRSFVGGGVFIQENGRLYLQKGAALRGNEAREAFKDMTWGFSSPAVGTGGGVCVEAGYVYLYDGTISRNRAESTGGGMYVNAGVAQLAGGTITENSAGRYGGGVGIMPTNQSTKVLVGNEPYIAGNTSDDPKEGDDKYFHNVYMDGAEDEAPRYSTVPMYIGAALGEKARIGVSRWVRPDEEHPYRVVAKPLGKYAITANDLARFHSDDPSYVLLLNDDGDIVLIEADVVFNNQGHGGLTPGQRLGDERKVDKPEDLAETGYDFCGWYIEPECQTPWDFESETVVGTQEAKLVLYAKWRPTLYTIRYDLKDGINAVENPGDYTIESETITLQEPVREGYTFTGWTWEGQDDPQKEVTIPEGSVGEKVFTAQWEKEEASEPGPGSEPEPDPEPEPAKPSGGSHKHTSSSDPEPAAGPAAGTETGSDGYQDCPRDDTCPIWPYEDAGTREWYHDGVHYCIENGFMVGYENGRFGPNDHLTRAQLIQILYNREGKPAVTGESVFADVAEDSWYAPAILWAEQNGVARGYGNGFFGPEDDVTREQLAVVLWQYIGSPASEGKALDFDDGDEISSYALEALQWAVENKVVSGFGNGRLDPKGPGTRAQAATMFQRFFTTLLP